MRINCQVQIFEQLARAPVKFFPTNPAELAWLAAEKNVFADCHLPDERQFLIDNRNAGLFRVANTAELLRATFDKNFATILRVWIDAAENLHQRRLTRA